MSGKLGSGTDSSQYGEKNEMMNTKKITLVRKTANFKERDAKNHSPNAIMFSLVSVGADNGRIRYNIAKLYSHIY